LLPSYNEEEFKNFTPIKFLKGLLASFSISIILLILLPFISLFLHQQFTFTDYLKLFFSFPVAWIGLVSFYIFSAKYILSIRRDILIRLIVLSFIYTLLLLTLIYGITRALEYYTYKYYMFIAYTYSEVQKLYASNNLGWIDTVRSFLNFIIIINDNYYIVVILFSFLFIWFYTSKTKLWFVCPHCKKNITFKKLYDISCPVCMTDNHSRFELLLYCSSCHESIPYFNCPHCSHPINIKEKYEPELLIKQRKDYAKVLPSYLTGLRELYNRKKRLPVFTCPHCIKTLITKNFNLICPNCSAHYLVTDNRTHIQLGDVKIKNFRYIGDESTMEKVIFGACIQCGRIIESINCYHPDCGKEIDLRAEYDEIELLRRHYEQK